MQPEAPSDPRVEVRDLSVGRVSFTDQGPAEAQGPPIVAIHGLPGSARDFRWLGAALEPRQRFVRLNMPAFGQTPLSSMRRAGLVARADWVVRVLAELGLESAVLLGHSMGGVVATAACARHPQQFSGLALLASIGPRPHRSVRKMAVPPSILSGVLRVPGAAHLLEDRLRREFERSGFKSWTREQHVHSIHCLAALRFSEHARNLKRLRLPTLVAWAADDPFIEEAISEALYWQCPEGPRVRFDTGGHNLQKTRAIELASALVEWTLGSHPFV